MNLMFDSFLGETDNGKPTILIVDDDEDTCELIGYLLSDDFNCDIAFDGEQALKKIRQREYSVLLVDLMLPKIDGFSLIKSAAKCWPATPVIIISAVAEVEAAIKAMKIGAFAYIVKPFEPTQVEMGTKRAFNHHLFLSEMRMVASR